MNARLETLEEEEAANDEEDDDDDARLGNRAPAVTTVLIERDAVAVLNETQLSRLRARQVCMRRDAAAVEDNIFVYGSSRWCQDAFFVSLLSLLFASLDGCQVNSKGSSSGVCVDALCMMVTARKKASARKVADDTFFGSLNSVIAECNTTHTSPTQGQQIA